ncbi:MAG: hypothetical protein RI560_05685, partial [Natronomonas sp.]|nr:hypothetical protein [Natronomonas sp.]
NVTETVTQTETATVSETILEQGLDIEVVFDVQAEPVDPIGVVPVTMTPPPPPTRRFRFDDERSTRSRSVAPTSTFDDAVFENPTQGLVEADAELADLGEGFDAP